MKRFLFLFAIISIFSFCLTTKANAQFLGAEPVDQIINTEIVPNTPRANDQVNITIESFSYDLSHAKIWWYVNDALRDSGISKKSFTFTTGPVGSVSNIKYQIETAEGVKFEKTIKIIPSEVTLLWESSSYTPPFFRGKALFSFEGQLRLVALPNILKPDGTKYRPDELIYTWKRGMGTDTDASGYGKNIFFWNGDVVSSPEEIDVEVSDIKNTTKATASIVVDPVQTEILAYENNPSLGILFNKAITNTFNLSNNEVSFVAEPFYFNNPDMDGTYSWYVNGNLSGESTKNITFRNTTGQGGYSKIDFDLTSKTKIMQSANSAFDINFNTNKNIHKDSNYFMC